MGAATKTEGLDPVPRKPPVFRPPSVVPSLQAQVKRRHDTNTYDAQWRRLRRVFIANHPVCCVPGCGLPASDVDHIASVRERPDLRLVYENLRPYCHAHHSQRTALEQGFAAPHVRREP